MSDQCSKCDVFLLVLRLPPSAGSVYTYFAATPRYEFFAPIWRVMRDDNMPVAEVARQVEAVALAVKQGSSVSDMRHHTLTGKVKGAQVGAWPGPWLMCVMRAEHGLPWYAECQHAERRFRDWPLISS